MSNEFTPYTAFRCNNVAHKVAIIMEEIVTPTKEEAYRKKFLMTATKWVQNGKGKPYNTALVAAYKMLVQVYENYENFEEMR